jgi:succinate-semialdehyde dehydrogenase/glutarate-semialdehyde dehydrogenase
MELRREASLIGGAWRTGDRWMDVDNPADGSLVGRVPALGEVETREAIAAAKGAMGKWQARTAGERARVLRRLYELIRDNAQPLAALLTAEQGKPFAEALGEIRYAASFVEWYAEEGKRIYGEVIPAHARDRRIVVLKQPVGVVGAITPWNFPAAMVTRKLAPALAAGCGIVLKPAEQTPFTALALGALALEAGVPAGLVNIVTGPALPIGAELTRHPDVAKISFTGSTRVGVELMRQSAPTIKKLSLELGGNAPFIVFDDADLDAAVAGAILAKFRNAGQTCVCANRFLVQSGIHKAFVERLTRATRNLSVGPGTSPDTAIGPLIDEAALAKIEAHVADAQLLGACIETGGRRHALGGRYFAPTVLSGVTDDMLVCREETFGPVAPVIRFDTEAEAIARANGTPYGLAAYFYSRDLSRVWRVAEAIDAGIVGVNTGLISTEVAPFGGIKQSGLGREGSHYGIEDYLEIKYICLGLEA